MTCLRASVKLTWSQPGPFLVPEPDPTGHSEGVEVIPEVIPLKVLERNRRRVSVSIRNVTTSPVEVPARMLLGRVHQATPVALL